jgi:hypothetical protein
MTTHLSDSEFVDFAERRLGADRSSHLEGCPRCRAEAEEIRLTLDSASAIDVPEPSPLFWDHLSVRVREEIASGPAPRNSPWRRPIAALAWATAIALVAVITVRELPRPASPAPPPSPAGSRAALASPVDDAPADVPPNDAAWALLGAAASHMELDEAHAAGLTVRPSAVDRAVLDLTPAERDALAHLLQDELKRAGA